MPPRAWLRLAPLGLGSLIVPLDSAVNIAFPAITAHFGLPLPAIQWVIVCYVLTYGSLMLGIGRLGDLLGHRAVFRWGLAVSVVAYLLCAHAPSYGLLLAARVLQGIGAALVLSCGPALATLTFPEAMRSRALGAYLLVIALGGALGPSLGGALVHAFGWEAVFWFRAPIAAAALLMLAGQPAAPRPERRGSFDLAGAALLALAVGTALLAVNQARRLAAGEWQAAALVAAALAALGGFLRRSRRAANPIMDLSLFGRGDFALVNAANALVNFAGFAVLLVVPFFLVRVAALPAWLAGLVLAAGPLGAVLASPLGGWALARLAAPLPVAVAGLALAAGGLALIALWDAATGMPLLVLSLFAQGGGMGLFQVTCAEMISAAMRREDRGVAGSLAMLTRTLGVVCAASLLSLLFDAVEAAALAVPGAEPQAAFLAAFRATFAAAAAVPALLLAPFLLRALRR
ncbi:MFS transporter [Caldovatus sediminis]|uniref:MFS transporter n=1 Tax=Caldovatus sediminis TaxID=2041189 RepID=A0A8J2Z8P2_9PROT|nr:MFS transporter [Caldovatus sediminis]GGG20209.1 MFS transporter [Caldovatus sediminis]